MGKPDDEQSPFKLLGFNNFVRTNPKSDHFSVNRFDHIEFWCGNTTNTCRHFSWGLGMPLVAKSDLSTGNYVHASYLIRSGHLNFIFTAPYSTSISFATSHSAVIPTFSSSACHSFTASHGLGVRAVDVEVDDVVVAYAASDILLAEIELYGDVVLRFISFNKKSNAHTNLLMLPGFEKIDNASSYLDLDFGIRYLD